LIRGSNPKSIIIVHRDRDYLNENEAKKWEEDIRKMHANPFLTLGTDVESHFLNATHLANHNPATVQDIEQMIDVAYETSKEHSIKKFINGRIDIEKRAGTYGKIDVGSLAIECPNNISSDTTRFSHSKTVLKHLKREYKEKTKANLIVHQISSVLSVDSLQVSARKLWPKTKVSS
jgi:hypothetical protein